MNNGCLIGKRNLKKEDIELVIILETCLGKWRDISFKKEKRNVFNNEVIGMVENYRKVIFL